MYFVKSDYDSGCISSIFVVLRDPVTGPIVSVQIHRDDGHPALTCLYLGKGMRGTRQELPVSSWTKTITFWTILGYFLLHQLYSLPPKSSPHSQASAYLYCVIWSVFLPDLSPGKRGPRSIDSV